MLNNLTNFYNLIKTRAVLNKANASDLLTLGVRDDKYDGGYKPMAITAQDFLSDCVQSVTGLDTDNTDPQHPIVKISVDNNTITGLGTPASPLVANPPQTSNFGLYTQTNSSTPVTGIVEASLLDGGIGTLTVPANGFQVGDSFLAVITGHISAANNDTLTLRIKTGSVVLATTGAITTATATGKHYKLEVLFTVRAVGVSGVAKIVSGGMFSYTKNASNAFEGTNFSTETSTGFDTTVSNTLTITAQWGSANAANSIYSEICTLTKTF